MTGWGGSSRAAATCAALATIAVSTPARAQPSASPGRATEQSADVLLELQVGSGYLFRDGDLASLPSVEVGVVLWGSESWGFSLRRSTTVGEHMASYDYGDGTRTGGRGFRHWTGTLRYRRALAAGLELNVGGGVTIGVYDHLTCHHGPRVSPRPESRRYNIGGFAGEVLVGKRITSRLGIEAGLVVHPFLDERAAVVPVAFGVVSF